jgi:hypothetical protein
MKAESKDPRPSFTEASDTGPIAVPGGLRSRLADRLHEAWRELHFGIRTRGQTTAVEFRPDGSIWKNYAPIGYRSFEAVMDRITVRPGQDVFIDYGAGRGRAVVLAATRPFRRVLGVEVRAEFAAAARANLRRAARRLLCPQVEIVEADGVDVGVPDDATMLHLFDPFAGTTLERLVDEIHASLRRRPRVITILFADDHHFAELVAARPWIRFVERVPWALVRRTHPERCNYGIYRAEITGNGGEERWTGRSAGC